jgi:hypothetical protein
MDRSLNYMLAPAIIGVGGVFLLGFGLLPTLLLNLTGLAFGVNNALHPNLVVSDPHHTQLPPLIETNDNDEKRDDVWL